MDGDYVVTLGYHSAGDGGGQKLSYRRTGRSGITVDNGFYFAGHLADDYYEAVDKGAAWIERFGARTDNVDATAAIQAASDASEGFRPIKAGPGKFRINSTVTLKAPLYGTAGAAGGNFAQLPATVFTCTNINDGSACFTVDESSSHADYMQIRDIHILGGNSDNIGVEWKNATGDASRYLLDNVRVRQCGTGFYLRGWIGTIFNCFTSGCADYGFRIVNGAGVVMLGGESANAVGATGVELAQSNGVKILGHVIEGQGATGTGLKVLEGCHGVYISTYFEAQVVHIDIGTGGTGQAADAVEGVTVEGCHFTNGSGVPGAYSIFGNVHGLTFGENSWDSTDVRIESAARYVSLGRFTPRIDDANGHFDGILESSAPINPIRRLNFETNYELNGASWTSQLNTNCTVTQETSIVRGTNRTAMRITQLVDAGQTSRPRARLKFPQERWMSGNLAGKRVYTSCWIYVPAEQPEYESGTLAPDILFGYDDDTVEKAVAAMGSFPTRTGTWRHFCTWRDIVDDGSTIDDFGVWITVTNAGDAGNNYDGYYIVVGDLLVWIGDPYDLTPTMTGEAPLHETLTDVFTSTETAGTAALPVFGSTQLDSSAGAITATLGRGAYIGQRKRIVMTNAANSSMVSVTNHETSDPEVYTFDAVDEVLILEWTGTEWITIYATATT